MRRLPGELVPPSTPRATASAAPWHAAHIPPAVPPSYQARLPIRVRSRHEIAQARCAVEAIQFVFDLDRHINNPFVSRHGGHSLLQASPKVGEVGPEACPGRCRLAEHDWESLLVVVETDAVVDGRQGPATTAEGCLVTVHQRLTEREREVVRARFPASTRQPSSSPRSAERLGVSAERVRQIEEHALAKLRSA